MPDGHRNSLSPRRLPSFKKKSSYASRKLNTNTIPYVPKNRPVTPNIAKGLNNHLLSDMSESSQEPEVQLKNKLVHTSKVEKKEINLNPLVNPFMAREP
jgi:hypothetical protein